MKAAAEKRIIIFNVNWVGDVLFSTAVVRNVRRNFPDSYICCAVPSRCYQVLKGNPNIDEIMIYDDKERQKSLFAKFDFVKALRYKQFDMAILLHGSMTRALLCRLADIPERIGYDTKKRGFILTKKIPLPKKDSLHRIDYYLNIIEKAGLRIEDRYLEFFVDEEDMAFVDNFLEKNGIPSERQLIIGINPGGNWMPKRWPRENWVSLVKLLSERLGADIIITGGRQDQQLAGKIREESNYKPLIACGVFNLKQSAALFKKIGVFISADSGPMHIANAVGAKHIIALFGPTDPLITGPFPLKNVKLLQKDTGCKIPCYEVNCKDNRCMKAISPEEVFSCVEEVLGKS
ncbi:MAG: lipopolysaccharide heptosyltransferase II [Candidatus Portnoybacteria bacterium]|nr:lipopolysaccharide heptosyltransferase II [Candidatus Portnoybacteria bacterium]